MSALKHRRKALRSRTESFGTTTAPGDLRFLVFRALAQHEPAWIRERVVVGLAAANRCGWLADFVHPLARTLTDDWVDQLERIPPCAPGHRRRVRRMHEGIQVQSVGS